MIKCHWWKLLNPLLLEDARSLLWETDKSFHSIVCLSPSNCCQLSLYYCHGNNCLGHSGRTVHCPVLELHPFSESTATICGERLYIGGGFTSGAIGTESVVMCEVKDLLQSQPQSLATRLLGRRSVWTEISPLPVILSFLVTFQGQLLAVGGTSAESNAKVRQYDDSTDSWKVIGHMKVKLRNCLAAVLPNNALIVCGENRPNGHTATVEVASLYQTAHSKILLPHATTK